MVRIELRGILRNNWKLVCVRPTRMGSYECDQKLLTEWKASERERRDATSTRFEGAEEGAKLRRTGLPNSERESLVESEGATKV